MKKRKTLQELTLKDNFMFGAVMVEEENCRTLLELALGITISHIEVSKEKSIVYNPEYKGVRLDVIANDDNQTRFNVEMQSVKKSALGRRSRYYHSQIDMEMFYSGIDYQDLADAYVISICDFDPFGKQKYRYRFDYCCREDPELLLKDGGHTVFLSTKGKNDGDIPDTLKKFLRFVGPDLKSSTEEFYDEYVKRLQTAVNRVKASREMGGRYMIFQEMLKEEREEGKEEGILDTMRIYIFDLLDELGSIPDEWKSYIEKETDHQVLRDYHKKAARAQSIEQFLNDISE